MPLLKISKTKNDLSMKMSSQKHVFFSIVCLFSCLVCVTWCYYDVISVYQKSFRIVYIGAFYVFLVSHCYTWNKQKKEITSKFHFCWENLDIDMIISNIKISNMINKETKVRNIGLGFTIVINYKILLGDI